MLRRSRRRVLASLGAAALVAALLLILPSRSPMDLQARSRQAGEQASNVASEDEARQACGTACHAFPPPEILPRNVWRDTIARMMLIAQGDVEPTGPVGTAGRTVRLSPELQRVVRYYHARAPESLPPPTPWPAADASGFTTHTFSPPDPPPIPAVSHVRFADMDGDGRLELLAADMRYGMVVGGRPWEPGGRLELLGTIPNPAHVEPFDLDGDGTKDLLVADLGAFTPSDHLNGAVVWMRGLKRHAYEPLSLGGWPRVADVRAGDFNGDGKPDLLVAAFGWRKAGRVVVLENRTIDYRQLSFEVHEIDPRSGSVHAIPTDVNGDGRLDVVALLAQQYESVIAYINKGGFSFEPQIIYAAPHPNSGSSGIQLVDLDGDGDLDLLVTHGDTFDDQIIKPYHGILWLENKGSYPYTAHWLADLPGAFRAQAGDLDGDGDLDIVASAFMAADPHVAESDMPALVWLEQVKPGVFERRTLARRPPRHATLDLADYDGDGDLDIVVGMFATSKTETPWVEVWENTRSGKGSGPRARGSGR